tara:strand:- start:332 stop:613 length:282 start_codon:yes stop_codon:yes gene_type:complete
MTINKISNESEEVMQIDLPINANDYLMEKVRKDDGTILISIKPKKRNCKICKKRFESNQTQFLCWRTKEGYSVSAWLCRKHYYQAKELIKENR